MKKLVIFLFIISAIILSPHLFIYADDEQISQDLTTARDLDQQTDTPHYERSEKLFIQKSSNPDSELRNLPYRTPIADDIQAIRDAESQGEIPKYDNSSTINTHSLSTSPNEDSSNSDE